jgi:hypothetical protein
MSYFYSNITIPATTATTYTLNSGATWLATSGSSNYSYNNTTQGAIDIKGDANVSGNLTVQGRNISELFSTIEQRLAILIPDPKLLAKYTALQQAYDHYKTLEALCIATDQEDK